jgi:toxin ParE1/3/4
MSFARRQTKTSTSRHTTWQQQQALKRAIAFSWLTQETFALLSTQFQMGWPLRLRNLRLASLRVFRISGFEKMLVLYTHLSSGVEIVRVIHGSRDLVAFLRRERLSSAFHRSPTNIRAATTLMAARPNTHTVLRNYCGGVVVVVVVSLCSCGVVVVVVVSFSFFTFL